MFNVSNRHFTIFHSSFSAWMRILKNYESCLPSQVLSNWYSVHIICIIHFEYVYLLLKFLSYAYLPVTLLSKVSCFKVGLHSFGLVLPSLFLGPAPTSTSDTVCNFAFVDRDLWLPVSLLLSWLLHSIISAYNLLFLPTLKILHGAFFLVLLLTSWNFTCFSKDNTSWCLDVCLLHGSMILCTAEYLHLNILHIRGNHLWVHSDGQNTTFWLGTMVMLLISWLYTYFHLYIVR